MNAEELLKSIKDHFDGLSSPSEFYSKLVEAGYIENEIDIDKNQFKDTNEKSNNQ